MTQLHPAAPAWTGDLRDLSEEVLFQRDRELARHISSILVHYDHRHPDAYRRATPAEQRQSNLSHRIDALTDVRNEMDRRLQTGHWEPLATTDTPNDEGDHR